MEIIATKGKGPAQTSGLRSVGLQSVASENNEVQLVNGSLGVNGTPISVSGAGRGTSGVLGAFKVNTSPRLGNLGKGIGLTHSGIGSPGIIRQPASGKPARSFHHGSSSSSRAQNSLTSPSPRKVYSAN